MRVHLLQLVGAALGLWAGTSLGAAEPPAALSLADLVNRPDRWPATVTVQRDWVFSPTAAVHAGDKAQVQHFDGTKVLLLAANGVRFTATAADAGLLAAANQEWAALTPAQRAVDPAALAADPSLWPARIKTTTTITCSFGKLPPGAEVEVYTVSATGTGIRWPNSPNRISLPFDCTDVFAGARQLALVERESRPSRIAAALEANLVDSDGKPYRDPRLGEKKIFALYFGAGWCAPCHAFSPDLVKFLDQALPKHPELAAVFLSNDKQLAGMLAYMKEQRMPFPAVPLAALQQSPVLLGYAAEMIPQLVIVDRFGTVLASNDDRHGHRGDPEDTLGALDRLLAAPATQ